MSAPSFTVSIVHLAQAHWEATLTVDYDDGRTEELKKIVRTRTGGEMWADLAMEEISEGCSL